MKKQIILIGFYILLLVVSLLIIGTTYVSGAGVSVAEIAASAGEFNPNSLFWCTEVGDPVRKLCRSI